MKISTHDLLRLAGVAALLAGICYVLVGLFHPANVASAVTTTRWQVVHVLACAMSVFGLLGLTGLYARQAVKTGWLGLGELSAAQSLADTGHGCHALTSSRSGGSGHDH
jgi:hypothetical protein